MERNTLMEWVYPKIKEYCREKHGLEFQVQVYHKSFFIKFLLMECRKFQISKLSRNFVPESCHFNRLSNVEIGVEYQMIVVVANS